MQKELGVCVCVGGGDITRNLLTSMNNANYLLTSHNDFATFHQNARMFTDDFTKDEGYETPQT